MPNAFQANAFQISAFQIKSSSVRANLTSYVRNRLNDLENADTSTHSVSFTTSVRDADLITYLRRRFNDLS